MTNDFSKGPFLVLGPEDGDSFWQPLPSTGYITNKITPYTANAMALREFGPQFFALVFAHGRPEDRSPVMTCFRTT